MNWVEVGLKAIVQKHVWDQLFTVDTIWNIGETGDINSDLSVNDYLQLSICYK